MTKNPGSVRRPPLSDHALSRSISSCERHGPQQARRPPLTPENVALTCGLSSALGGTRTPNLLNRRRGQVVQERPSPVVDWADIPGLSTCVGCCSAAWLQSRRNGADPRPSANEAG